MSHFDIVKTNEIKNTFRVSKIQADFDIKFEHANEHFVGDIDLPEKWNIGVIVGGSGTGKTTIAKELNVEVSELLNAKKMSKEELEILRDTINNTLLYSENEKNNKKEKINKYFRLGLLCILVVILDHQFELLSYIFKGNIPDFIDGALCGLGLLFEFIGFYNNNHEMTLKQKKLSLIKKNK